MEAWYAFAALSVTIIATTGAAAWKLATVAKGLTDLDARFTRFINNGDTWPWCIRHQAQTERLEERLSKLEEGL